MGYDQRDLGIGAGIWVAGIALMAATYISLGSIYEHYTHMYYPEAQKKLYFIFLAPMIVGWPTWVILLLGTDLGLLEYALDIYKAVVVYFFLTYFLSMIGKEPSGEGYTYSEQNMKNAFLRMGKVDHLFNFCGSIKLKDEKKVDTYIKQVKWIAIQYGVGLALICITTILLKVVDGDNLHYGEMDPAYGYFWISLSKIVLTFISLYCMYIFLSTIQKMPEIKGYKIKAKFYTIKISVVLSQIQAAVFGLFAEWNWIADKDEYDVEYITSFSANFLMCIEMIILSFVLMMIFPASEYLSHSDYEKVAISDITSEDEKENAKQKADN